MKDTLLASYKQSWLTTLTLALVIFAGMQAPLLTAAESVPDPTRPSGYQSKAISPASAYRLESVLLGNNRKVAIINGKSFSEGDKTALGTLALIEKDKVVIRGSKQHVLRLFTQSIKQPPEQQ